MKIKEFVKSEIIDKLECFYKGFNEKLEISGLSSDLFYSECTDEKYFEDTKKATQWINDNLDEFRYIFECMTHEYGNEITNKILINIFDKPNKFIVDVVIYEAAGILNRCKTIQKLWNNSEVILTDELIDKIIFEIKKI